MNKRQQTILAVSILGALALVSATAAAGPVETFIPAGQGAGSPFVSSYAFTDENQGWTVENSFYHRTSVYLDPNAGPWHKYLETPDSGFEVGGVYMLKEVLMVRDGGTGYTSWTDYHEQILTPGWEWYEDPFGVAWSFTSNQSGLTAAHKIDGKFLNVDWTFSPQANTNTIMTITKFLRYNGEGSPFERLVVAEYPTATAVPEPGTFALLAVALAGATAYVWRKRK
jgi:hypothetical protein